jgi:hypothetical protein
LIIYETHSVSLTHNIISFRWRKHDVQTPPNTLLSISIQSRYLHEQ